MLNTQECHNIATHYWLLIGAEYIYITKVAQYSATINNFAIGIVSVDTARVGVVCCETTKGRRHVMSQWTQT